MTAITRLVTRTLGTRVSLSVPLQQPRRWAHQSYGNEQSGHEQGLSEDNPKRHLEHPGPETPASKSSSDKSTGSGQGSGSNQSKDSARPAIHEPKSAAEEHDPDVRKHNEEMRQRADRSANQLSEGDNKVDKKFWKGDVGDMKEKKN